MSALSVLTTKWASYRVLVSATRFSSHKNSLEHALSTSLSWSCTSTSVTTPCFTLIRASTPTVNITNILLDNDVVYLCPSHIGWIEQETS
ncbi:hypothetical protein GUJ93_ZPchr0011g27447 [Zizania palustris]|uniref:Uncharacterized protein n=1 Tax=Zizania palustris TaxID=103762 RepID=A0A8J6BNU1_ZIZPA|nr:hypothetical protein GUJ93_ZPchr0011g27447 [Zizania palustris]